MEATKEQRRGLLQQIIPPRLEDAGLEDCALPPDAIKAAFLRAATAVIFTSDDEDENGDCVTDPWPEAADRSDVVDGRLTEVDDSPGSCIAMKGLGETVDDLVVGSDGERREKDCVDGLQGLEIGEKKKNGEAESVEEDEERPILVGGYDV